MAEFDFENRYCIDSSSLIFMKNTYPPKTFLTLWKKLSDLASNGILISPHEVFIELDSDESHRKDEIARWARENKTMFVEVDNEQIAFASEIVRKFPKLVDVNKTTEDADPFVIALAKSKGATVITEEKHQPSNSKKTGIPNVCEHYQIKYVKVIPFIESQNWQI